MNDTKNNSSLHELGQAFGNTVTAVSIVVVFFQFINWLCDHKWTVWLGLGILAFIPVTLVVIVVSALVMNAIDSNSVAAPMSSEQVRQANDDRCEIIFEISSAISVGIGIAMSLAASAGDRLQEEAKKKAKNEAEVKWYDKEPKHPDDIMFSYWEGRIHLDAQGNEVTDGGLTMAEVYGKISICICRDGHGITKTRAELAAEGVLEMCDEQDFIR